MMIVEVMVIVMIVEVMVMVMIVEAIGNCDDC